MARLLAVSRWLGAAVVGGALLAACGSAPAGPTVASVPASLSAEALEAAVHRAAATGFRWMVSADALSRLASAGLPQALLHAYFDRPGTIVIGSGTPSALAPDATNAVSFTSAAALETALARHRIPSDVSNVVLDLEAWPLTPVGEQHQPIHALEAAVAAARSAGKEVIFTPGTDLIRVLAGRKLRGAAFDAVYDRLLVGPGVDASDVFEIQAQGEEGSSQAASFVTQALATAHRARPAEPVLVGLSTNPDGRVVSPADLLDLVRAAHSAAGFWLNVPQAGPACPRCREAQPQVGVAFLERLAGLPSTTAGAAPSGTHGSRSDVASGAPGGDTGAPGAAPVAGPVLDPRGALLAAGGQPADWILSGAHFAEVVSAPGVAQLMAGGQVFEPLGPHETPSGQLPVIVTVVFHSETAFEDAVAAGQVPADVRAALYDNERTSQTPPAEQEDPASYDARAASLAHAHGWTSICDLIEPDRLPSSERTSAVEVPACDVVGLNTVQQSERNPAAFAALVRRDVGIVHAVAPGRPVLAGLSSNPAGGPVTADELAADITATHDLVAGYWLNVPAPGVDCPRCGPPDPTLMADALSSIETAGR
jgi:hypothetical protein